MSWYGFYDMRFFPSNTYRDELGRRYLSNKSSGHRPNLTTFRAEDYSNVSIHDAIRCPFSGGTILLRSYNSETSKYYVSGFSKEPVLSKKSQLNLHKTYSNYYQLSTLSKLSKHEQTSPYGKRDSILTLHNHPDHPFFLSVYLGYATLLRKSLKLKYDTSYVSKFIELHFLINTSYLYVASYTVHYNFIDYSFKLSQKDLSKLFTIKIYDTDIVAYTCIDKEKSIITIGYR